VRRFGDGVEKYTGVKFMDIREDMAKFAPDGVPDWDSTVAKW